MWRSSSERICSGLTAGQLVQMHITESLPDLNQFSDDLPEAIHDIVEKATSKQPDERYKTARDLWREFHRVTSKGDTATLDREVVERRETDSTALSGTPAEFRHQHELAIMGTAFELTMGSRGIGNGDVLDSRSGQL